MKKAVGVMFLLGLCVGVVYLAFFNSKKGLKVETKTSPKEESVIVTKLNPLKVESFDLLGLPKFLGNKNQQKVLQKISLTNDISAYPKNTGSIFKENSEVFLILSVKGLGGEEKAQIYVDKKNDNNFPTLHYVVKLEEGVGYFSIGTQFLAGDYTINVDTQAERLVTDFKVK